jgi:hypothetical protein
LSNRVIGGFEEGLSFMELYGEFFLTLLTGSWFRTSQPLVCFLAQGAHKFSAFPKADKMECKEVINLWTA